MSAAVHLTLGIHCEGELGHTQFITFRSQNFLICVLPGQSRERRHKPVFAGISLADDFAFFVPDLNQRIRQIIRSGNIQLGNPGSTMNDLIDNGSLECEFADSLVRKLFPVDIDMVSGFVDLPPVRGGDFFQRIVSMREVPGKGSFAVLISHCYTDQRSLGKRSAGILDLFMVIETENKAFARSGFNFAGNQPVVMLFGYDDLLCF